MSNDAILMEIRELAAGYGERHLENVHASTRLVQDLGLDGEDAELFMAEFADRYEVDMGAFRWARYFHDEGSNPWAAWIVRWRLRDPAFVTVWRAAEAQEREIDIAHLVEVAHAGRWLHPGPDRRPAPRSVTALHMMLNFLGAVVPLLLTVAAVTVSVFILLAGVASGGFWGLFLVTLFLLFHQWRSWMLALREIEAKLASATDAPPP